MLLAIEITWLGTLGCINLTALQNIVLHIIGLVSDAAKHSFEIIPTHRTRGRVIIRILSLHVTIGFLLHGLVFLR